MTPSCKIAAGVEVWGFGQEGVNFSWAGFGLEANGAGRKQPREPFVLALEFSEVMGMGSVERRAGGGAEVRKLLAPQPPT